MCKVITLNTDYKPLNNYALETVMNYRGISSRKISRNLKNISESDINKFLKGNKRFLSNEDLQEIMKFLDWPFNFLYKEIKPIKSSLNLR